jgi:hypothetical protein
LATPANVVSATVSRAALAAIANDFAASAVARFFPQKSTS